MDQHEPTVVTDGVSLQAEAAAIERGLADIEAGRVYRVQTVLRWLDRLDEDPATPEPTYD